MDEKFTAKKSKRRPPGSEQINRELPASLEQALSVRGISESEYHTKMANLERLGPRVIRQLGDDWYFVEGERHLYNPVIDVWLYPLQASPLVKAALDEFLFSTRRRRWYGRHRKRRMRATVKKSTEDPKGQDAKASADPGDRGGQHER